MDAAAHPPERTSSAELEAMWRRQEPWWHAVFALAWLAAVVVSLLEPAGEYGRWPGIALLVVVAVAYATLGVRGLRQDERAGIAYQVVAWGALLVTFAVDPDTESWLLYYVFFPQMWAMMRARRAALGSALALAAVAALRLVQSGFSRDALGPIVVSSLISLGISLALGLFINRIVDEADARARTIDELRATQARLVAVERDRGVHEERERVSREIHDTLAQGFTSVITLARAADAALARGDADATRERLRLIEATAADNLREARLIVAELTPGHLQSRTLVEALERLTTAVSSENGVRADLRVAGEPVPLRGATEVVILRTAQEALSNVRRHAAAEHVGLELDYDDPARVVLTVADDGRGFDPDAGRSGFGLDGVLARVGEVGGRVAVDTAPGRGTTLRLEVPR